ncbi:MAG: UbiD family decarboxylase, partial [Saprospiraceae bacterium]|nr:UbiD family decarboxylase [Saprospiraceae bacterium]
MSYKSLRECANDLEKTGQLIRIKEELDPDLEIAEVHRRIYDKQGPALLFEKVKGSPFQAISNIYGTFERTEFLFRKTFPKVQKVINLKADPTLALKSPLQYASAPFTALTALPKRKRWNVPVMYGQTTIDKLPLIKSWPMDGGAFVTLPQVMSLPPGSDNIMESNIGMYRIQLTGNDYTLNEEIGLHYQLHRGIGVHHQQYNNSDKPFKVAVFVGGPPSHAFCAIMPLPEGLSEVTFAGMLAGRRFRYTFDNGFPISADADFVITGTVIKDKKKSEGPFGDHLGYYSLAHDFPYMKVDKVYHRKNPLWHFSVVGRPPQEDTSFGYLIHELVKPLTTSEFPGIKEVNAVDAAGVHPLLLAIGSERYMPFREPKPEEILTQANHLLGKGQTSLAKYLWIADGMGYPELHTHEIPSFFTHMLERVDWTRDLHFQTKTTIDTLDYSGSGWNEGSKVIVSAAGPKRRDLAGTLPNGAMLQLPDDFQKPKMAGKGILVISGPKWSKEDKTTLLPAFLKGLESLPVDKYPLVIIVDDSEFTTATLNNWLWVTFTRSNPSHDIYGVKAIFENKHWGCEG